MPQRILSRLLDDYYGCVYLPPVYLVARVRWSEKIQHRGQEETADVSRFSLRVRREARLAQEKRGRAPALHTHRDGCSANRRAGLSSGTHMARLRPAPTDEIRLLLGVGSFLCGGRLGCYGPGRDDAIGAGVGDGLAEVFVEVGDY